MDLVTPNIVGRCTSVCVVVLCRCELSLVLGPFLVIKSLIPPLPPPSSQAQGDNDDDTTRISKDKAPHRSREWQPCHQVLIATSGMAICASSAGVAQVMYCMSKPPLLPPSHHPVYPPSLPLLQAYFDAAASAADGGGVWVMHVAAPLLVLSGRHEGRKGGREGGRGGAGSLHTKCEA